ncbi:MAG: 4-(cytidine 5'-diphospho)-2-C-methyl-D-erythritol kinase [Candidatus Sulfotelmatobacter sp.]|jgi:4-diphosphocytidyl-2-C-methyl-D-erythritol kinase
MAYNLASMLVTVRSFAKINLGLYIGRLREDGFHELLTAYQTIGLHDLIGVSVGRGSGIEIRCKDPKVPKDESNTCYRIVDKAMQALNAKGRVVIEIEKDLPVQGGLGGASANAVATLLALERALRKSLPAVERLRITAEVGSDLPLFLVGGTVLGVGRGEQVYPLQDLPAMACVVMTPQVGVSTPKAFAEWDRLCGAGALARETSPVPNASRRVESSGPAGLRPAGQPRAAVPTPADASKLTLPTASDRMIELGQGLSAWLGEMYSGAPFGRGRAENPLLALVRAGIKNDFEEVVFPEYPELSEGKCALERAGAKYASLSGSGSALYGLFASKEAARAAAAKLRRQGWAAQSTVTLRRREYWKRILAG